mmetsp:Transcript_15325/g.51731  ORF Transcript_15325/g.51731 Transcript_15325/m.51731 type:complete len:235 (+) Transcript_15325:829-1533(+)
MTCGRSPWAGTRPRAPCATWASPWPSPDATTRRARTRSPSSTSRAFATARSRTSPCWRSSRRPPRRSSCPSASGAASGISWTRRASASLPSRWPPPTSAPGRTRCLSGRRRSSRPRPTSTTAAPPQAPPPSRRSRTCTAARRWSSPWTPGGCGWRTRRARRGTRCWRGHRGPRGPTGRPSAGTSAPSRAAARGRASTWCSSRHPARRSARARSSSTPSTRTARTRASMWPSCAR